MKKNRIVNVYAPVKGVTSDLKDLNDPIFSQQLMGTGVSIVPQEAIITAPVAGELLVIMPTNHAFGMKTSEGITLLVHISTTNSEKKIPLHDLQRLTEPGQIIDKGTKILAINESTHPLESLSLQIVVTAGAEKGLMTLTVGEEVNKDDIIIEIKS